MSHPNGANLIDCESSPIFSGTAGSNIRQRVRLPVGHTGRARWLKGNPHSTVGCVPWVCDLEVLGLILFAVQRFSISLGEQLHAYNISSCRRRVLRLARLQKALSKIGAGEGAGDCKRGGLCCGCGVVEARSLSVLSPCLGVCATFLMGGSTTAPPRIVGLRLAVRASQARDQLYRRIGSRQLLQWVVVGGNCRHGGPGPP